MSPRARWGTTRDVGGADDVVRIRFEGGPWDGHGWYARADHVPATHDHPACTYRFDRMDVADGPAPAAAVFVPAGRGEHPAGAPAVVVHEADGSTWLDAPAVAVVFESPYASR